MRLRTAVMLILVAVALISVGLGVRRGDLAPPETDAAAPEPVASAPIDSLIVMEVLNGTTEDGLARDVGLALGGVGATAERFANAPLDDYPHTLLINRRLDRSRALRLATDLGDLPLLSEFDARSHVDVVLVLGGDYDRVLSALGLHRAE